MIVMALTDFTQLEACKSAMDLTVEIHELTKKFPQSELYGLTSQIRRSSTSVPANIAEGFGRYTYADKKHKYVQARGELTETMTFIHLAERIKYISVEERSDYLQQCEHVHKLLNGLISAMGSSDK